MAAEYGIILIVIFITLSAFFSGSETSLTSINQAKVRRLLEEKEKGAYAIAKLKENTDRLLITILIGNNIVNIATASLATVIAVDIFGDIGVGIATFVVTIVMLIFGEIGPKTYAAKHPEKFALFSARFILLLSYILTPIFIISEGISKCRKKDSAQEQPQVTEEELKQWIDVSEETGAIEEEEHEMLCRVFKFNDTLAREAMTPRCDVLTISDDETLQNAVKILYDTGYTRIPIYHDEVDNIIGVINAKDIFQMLYRKKEGAKVTDHMYEAYFIPESKKIDDLLNELQRRKTHIAIVVDEYGTFTGIITMEDILEELVGDIMDEFDNDDPEICETENGVFIADASIRVEKINEELDIALPTGEAYDSLGGLLISILGHIPKRGEIAELPDGITLQVMKMRGRKIVNVKITHTQKKQTETVFES